MGRSVFSAIFSCLFVFPAPAIAQEKDKRSPNVPVTISEEAQRFLANAGADSPPPRNLKEWEAFQATCETIGKARYEATTHKYEGPGEIKTYGDVRIHRMTPTSLKHANRHKALIHVHGGGFCGYSAESSHCVCAPLAHLTCLTVYCIDYRLAPQNKYPAALDDCVTAYREMVQQLQPGNLGVLGESAGGSLALTMLLKSREEGLPMPAALACITPWADLTLSGESYVTNDGLDPVLSTVRLRAFAEAYAGNTDRNQSLLSPVLGDYTGGFPPTMIQTGTRDLLLSDCVRLHQKMKEAGVKVELSVREGMWHGYHVIPNSEFPEAKAGYRELADFFRRTLQL